MGGVRSGVWPCVVGRGNWRAGRSVHPERAKKKKSNCVRDNFCALFFIYLFLKHGPRPLHKVRAFPPLPNLTQRTSIQKPHMGVCLSSPLHGGDPIDFDGLASSTASPGSAPGRARRGEGWGDGGGGGGGGSAPSSPFSALAPADWADIEAYTHNLDLPMVK